MSNAEFSQLMQRIAIKYVHPNFDNRLGMWWSITIRTMGGREELFHTQNECRDLKESLFERVNKFLDELEA
jgi:hypothetical protein